MLHSDQTKMIPVMPRLRRCLSVSIAVLVLTGIYLPTLNAQTGKTVSAGKDAIADQTPVNWERDTDLLSMKIDRYKTASDAMDVILMAFPATDKTASTWIDELLPLLLKNEKSAGHQIFIINDDDAGSGNVKGPMNRSGKHADIATRSVTVVRTNKSDNLSFVARSVVRNGKPIQFSLLFEGKTEPTKQDREQASNIRFNAKIPVNEQVVFFGLEGMATLMTGPFLSPKSNLSEKGLAKLVVVESELNSGHSTERGSSAEAHSKSAVPRPETNAKNIAEINNTLAPEFAPLPGPQVKLTGKWLGSLPAGYRMHVRTTNYWTSSDLTSTRMLHLTLTGDGQFEKGSFSVSGGMGGMVSSIHQSDKTGSTGSVFGDTNPGGPGAKSVALHKRDNLDPSKYGVYFISGDQIELRHANNKTEKLSFKTDGYKELVINDKRYFNHTPDGWERRDDGKRSVYRSLDGAYRARVTKLDFEIPDGRKWMEQYLTRLKTKNLLASSGTIESFKGAYRHYNVFKVPVALKNNDGSQTKLDFYLKHGRSERRLIQIARFAGADGDETVLKFVRYLD